MSRATDRDFEVFGVDLKNKASVALSNTMKKTLGNLDREIAETVKAIFWFPGDPSKLAKKTFEVKGARISKAVLSYRFEAVSLSKYPMRQIRITTGNRRLRVVRGAGAGGKFSSSLTSVQQTVTLFKIRKSEGWRVSMGRVGYRYKGFLHTGTKGQFSSSVFERSQKETWSGGKRLPIHRLYGTSLVRLLQSHEIKALLESTKVFNKFEKDYFQAFSGR